MVKNGTEPIDGLTIALLVHGAIAAKVSQTVKAERTQPEGRITNREFALHNKAFQKACEKASTPPTKRQASKFRRKQGLAYQYNGAMAAKED